MHSRLALRDQQARCHRGGFGISLWRLRFFFDSKTSLARTEVRRPQGVRAVLDYRCSPVSALNGARKSVSSAPVGCSSFARTTVREVFEAFLAASDGKNMVVQELGAPAGYADRESFIGATPAL